MLLAGLLAPAAFPADFAGWTWTVEPLAEGYEGAEGPVWVPHGHLLFSDTRAQRIHKYVPGQGVTLFRDQSQGANGNALDRQGRLYTCEYVARRVTRTGRDGRVETLVERYDGKRLNAPNDIVVRRDGEVYFTDPLFTPLDSRELDFYGVYHLSPAGKLTLVARPAGRPNGVALSPDGRTLYVANTDEKNVRAYTLGRDGSVSGERVVVADLPDGPDGMKTDADGNLYVTADGVQVYGPDGRHLAAIPIPGGARNCAFGDRDGKTLYVTGRTTLYRVRVPVRGARP